jgi:hypothetical protein
MLVLLGYTVMETGKARSRVVCSVCKTRSFATGWQGNTPGLPDLYVHRQGWGRPIAVGLELKAKDGKPSEAQKWLADHGMTRIVRSCAEAMSAMLDIELLLGHRDQASRITDTMTMNNWEKT